jgi:branched-chain amino acid transport system ATP-binding protein
MTLRLSEVHGGYGATKVLVGVSVEVEPGSVVALLGSNGAGKTSTLRAVAGLLSLTAGSVSVDGNDLARRRPCDRPADGIGHVPEGRQLFAGMSVLDNLRLGAYATRRATEEMLGEVFALFPVLAEKRRARAGSLSGGQAQMLAIGRALMCRPRYLLLDEPSLGLSPMNVDRVFETILELAHRGVGIMLAEQNASRALEIAQTGYVLDQGRVTISGPGNELLGRSEIVESYLGGASA